MTEREHIVLARPTEPSRGLGLFWEDLHIGMSLVTIRAGYELQTAFQGSCVVLALFPDTSYVQAVAADGRVIERQFTFFFLP